MKKILLISDTHGYLDSKLHKHIAEADEVWHAGDIGSLELIEQLEKVKPVKAVFGNIDGGVFRQKFSEDLFFECESVKVYMTHIGGFPGKYVSRVKTLIQENKPQLFICGHSHILKVMFDKDLNVLLMNPGACGAHGFHTVKTALRFEIEGSDIKNLVVIELGPRTSLPS